jgi:hypothetical protein
MRSGVKISHLVVGGNAELITSYVCLCPAMRAAEKEKGGVRFASYGALELVLHDNPHSFLGLL